MKRAAPNTDPTLVLEDIDEPDSVFDRVPPLVEGYEVLELLAVGGMGELWRVHDPSLDRSAVMKVLRPEFEASTGARARFLAEAQATAQLDHPAIVPVHEVGQLADGRPYFTMREIRGRTLREAIGELHADPEAAARGGLQRMVQHFAVVCDAVAQAHARGVLHRDLKPENVMVGFFGEVQVMDWGLAKVRGRPDHELGEVRLSARDQLQTRTGVIVGTPAYMPPEQAAGDLANLDERADVYSLGAVLYELLAGRPPFEGPDVVTLLAAVRAGEPPPPIAAAFPVPAELVALCQRAMDPDRSRRLRDAAALADEVHAFVAGATRRREAQKLLDRAVAARAQVAGRRAEAARLRQAGEAALEQVGSLADEAAKAPGWALVDSAEALSARAELEDAGIDADLRAALGQAPDLLEARLALIERRRAELLQAEAAGLRGFAARSEASLRRQLDGLPVAHRRRRELSVWLQGDGAVSLVTAPAGATVRCLRFELHHRRLVARPFADLGRTPLAAVRLPMGSYLLEVEHPDRELVRYPVHIARGHHWDGLDPRGRPHVIRLPRVGDLAADECLVPGGWCVLGGDATSSRGKPRRRVWVPDVVVQRHPVTLRQLLERMNQLVAAGAEERALALAVRERPVAHGEPGAVLFGRRADGRFELVPDADGDEWDADWPAIMSSWNSAEAYARELAIATGQPWRLLTADEREKAARGVDGRLFPWGDHFEPTWSRNHASALERFPVPPGQYPVDESVYGVRDVAGNTRDWVMDSWTSASGVRSADDRVCLGGSWGLPQLHCRCDVLSALPRGATYGDLAFRLGRDW